MIHDDLGPVYDYINNVRPVVQATAEEMETETAKSQDNSEGADAESVVNEPTPKIHRIEPPDVLDIQTPFDPELNETVAVAPRVEREPLVCRKPVSEKPICYEPVSIKPNPDVPLGAGEFPFQRTIVQPPAGHVAVEFMPFLPPSPTKLAVPPIFRWAALIRQNPNDPPLKSAAQRRQIFQAAIKKVPYSRAVRGREYADRGVYEWKTCLGYVKILFF